jgi:hypothetical protein
VNEHGPSGQEGSSAAGEGGKEPKLPFSLKSLGDFFRRLLQLEGTVSAQIRKDVAAMQRQLDEQNGQLAILAEFVRMATSAHVEATAKIAALNAVETIVGARNATTSDRK